MIISNYNMTVQIPLKGRALKNKKVDRLWQKQK